MIEIDSIKKYFNDHFKEVSTDLIGWLSILFIHCATIPSTLGVIFGVTDRLPSLDVVAFLWFGLVLLFIKSLISKDMLNIITIGIGFIIQAFLLGFLVFK